MRKIVFSSYAELVDNMMDVANDGGTAYAICFFDDAKAVVKELLSREETEIAGINISEPNYCGYNKEYYISIDGDFLVDVEPAWHDKNEHNDAGYLWYDCEAVYVVGDANSASIKHIDKSKCFEIEFNLDEDGSLDDLLSIAQVIHDEDGNVLGFAINLETLLGILGE